MKITQNRRTVLFAVFICIIGLFFAACSNGSTDSKVVGEKYRFTGNWTDYSGGSQNGTITVGENTITTSTAGFSYSDVYTKGGGSISIDDWGENGKFAYLYSGKELIGISVVFNEGGRIFINLGKTCVDQENANGNVNTKGMQNTVNGYAGN